MPLDIHIGDVLELKKPHPCGSSQWQVIRVGADIGLRCLGCRRHLLLERHALERRLRSVVAAASLTAEASGHKIQVQQHRRRK